MKTRIGFVSNSSSSSFMFALPKEYDGKIKIVSEVDLKELGTICKTKKQLDRYLLDAYDYKTFKELFEDFSHIKKDYEEALSQIQEGKVIAIGNISNEGEPGTEYMLVEGSWTIQDSHVKQIGEIAY